MPTRLHPVAAGRSGGGTGGTRECQIWRTDNTDRARSLNRVDHIKVHKVVKGRDLVVDDLTMIMLCEIQVKNLFPGGLHFIE